MDVPLYALAALTTMPLLLAIAAAMGVHRGRWLFANRLTAAMPWLTAGLCVLLLAVAGGLPAGVTGKLPLVTLAWPEFASGGAGDVPLAVRWEWRADGVAVLWLAAVCTLTAVARASFPNGRGALGWAGLTCGWVGLALVDSLVLAIAATGLVYVSVAPLLRSERPENVSAPPPRLRGADLWPVVVVWLAPLMARAAWDADTFSAVALIAASPDERDVAGLTGLLLIVSIAAVGWGSLFPAIVRADGEGRPVWLGALVGTGVMTGWLARSQAWLAAAPAGVSLLMNLAALSTLAGPWIAAALGERRGWLAMLLAAQAAWTALAWGLASESRADLFVWHFLGTGLLGLWLARPRHLDADVSPGSTPSIRRKPADQWAVLALCGLLPGPTWVTQLAVLDAAARLAEAAASPDAPADFPAAPPVVLLWLGQIAVGVAAWRGLRCFDEEGVRDSSDETPRGGALIAAGVVLATLGPLLTIVPEWAGEPMRLARPLLFWGGGLAAWGGALLVERTPPLRNAASRWLRPLRHAGVTRFQLPAAGRFLIGYPWEAAAAGARLADELWREWVCRRGLGEGLVRLGRHGRALHVGSFSFYALCLGLTTLVWLFLSRTWS